MTNTKMTNPADDPVLAHVRLARQILRAVIDKPGPDSVDRMALEHAYAALNVEEDAARASIEAPDDFIARDECARPAIEAVAAVDRPYQAMKDGLNDWFRHNVRNAAGICRWCGVLENSDHTDECPTWEARQLLQGQPTERGE